MSRGADDDMFSSDLTNEELIPLFSHLKVMKCYLALRIFVNCGVLTEKNILPELNSFWPYIVKMKLKWIFLFTGTGVTMCFHGRWIRTEARWLARLHWAPGIYCEQILQMSSCKVGGRLDCHPPNMPRVIVSKNTSFIYFSARIMQLGTLNRLPNSWSKSHCFYHNWPRTNYLHRNYLHVYTK